ncbi:MAG: GGDEF domain-containing protein [Lachnospiraceae bacterium]|nr:GGDEF domain-containing protein [Lachnospiraceae bacterium]
MNAWKQEALCRLAGEYCWRLDDNYTWDGSGIQLAGLLGYSKEEADTIEGGGLVQQIEPETKDYVCQEMTRQLEAGDQVEMIFPAVHRDGHRVWLLNRGCKTVGDDGQQYLVGVLVDVTSFKKKLDAEKEITHTLRQMAQRDSLTKLYNARTARKMVETYLAEAQGSTGCALLIIDLDDFKQVNDQHGHLFGDAVLIEAAQTIQRSFRAQDVVGRIGGEEFMVLMKDVTDQSIVHGRCRQLNEAFREIQSSRLQGTMSCSIGVAFGPDHGTHYCDLFSSADRALYLAKDLGKDRYEIYRPQEGLQGKGKYAKKFGDYDASVYGDPIWMDEETKIEF